MMKRGPFLLSNGPANQILFTSLFANRERLESTTRDHWPSHIEGTQLHRMQSSEFERLLTQQFFGESASFRSAGRQVILRRTTRGTRRLQSSETHLRSQGYLIHNRLLSADGWLTYYANRKKKTIHVREQITDGHRSWSSPSSWFWQATLQPQSGPWLAITIITPLLCSEAF